MTAPARPPVPAPLRPARSGSPVLLSAHRGGADSGHVENSLAAFEAAVELGVDLVEFDVRVTADGRFVTSHDAQVPVGGRLVPIEHLTAAEVLALETGAALLEEVLALLAGRVLAHVDLKDARAELVVADACEAALGADRFVLTTEDDATVLRLRTARPHLQVALSLGRSARGLTLRQGALLRWSELFPARRLARCHATMVAVHRRLAWLTVLRWAGRHRVPVLVWTVNRPRLLRRVWRDPRVWAFTTDHPARALAVLAELQR